MKIGVLELLSENAVRSWGRMPHDFFVVKQYASIMPQAVSVWCRQMGHDVYYATYYGQKDPAALLPDDLDLLFLSCFSRGSGLAYALAKYFKLKNPRLTTVLGGAHARQFAGDALRFFDVVVQQCDRTLIGEILRDRPHGEVVTTSRMLKDIPSIEERLPEIRTAFFWKKKPVPWSFIPILSSTGCPYSCDFCVDWNNPYTPMPLERVRVDLNFAARHFPQVNINFYDPNFGVQFDRIMEVIESVPHPRERWFLTEGSLDSLTRPRLKRLKEAGCMCAIPGIESWKAYSKKSGVSRIGSSMDKLNAVVDRFDMIHEYMPIIQANLLFGLDQDRGDEPVSLNKAFITRTPYVSHTLNIPAPFGETPLFKRYMKKGRVLTSLPFTFYCKPYLATTIKHYSPIEFYEKLIDTFEHMASWHQQYRAVKTSRSWIFKAYHPIRNVSLKLMIRTLKTILGLMKTDPKFLAFHEGRSDILPEYYHRQYEGLLGRYKSLVSREDRIPMLEPGSGSAGVYKKTG